MLKLPRYVSLRNATYNGDIVHGSAPESDASKNLRCTSTRWSVGIYFAAHRGTVNLLPNEGAKQLVTLGIITSKVANCGSN